MESKERILSYLSKHSPATGKELRSHLGVSRQALHLHLRALIESGRVVKTGSTRGARYSAPGRAPKAAVVSRTLALAGLDESRVYEEVAVALNLRTALRTNVEAIAHYAFTEMLNNAIEHSKAEGCRISFRLEASTVSFEVRDRGVGVFESVASKQGLPSEHAALVEIMKGKATTMPESHTGEGLFFTSKVADRFLLESHRMQVEWNRFRDDVFVSERRFLEGTNVRFLLRRGTKHRLEEVFSRFAPADYDFQFQRTRILVKLLRRDYVSRSEARRLVPNLEKFKEVVLDFKDVRAVGQGFADEVFRVFAKSHPEVALSVANTNPAVEAMIRHAHQGIG